MEERKTDRRVIKTKRAIRDAFIKLLASKDFNEITVKDIADVADVDRKTVYNYYRGVYDIRDEVENELVQLSEEAGREFTIERIKNPLDCFRILSEVINKNIDLYGNLFKINANSQAMRKMKENLKIQVHKALSHDESLTEYQSQLCADFIASGMLTVFQKWFNSDRSVPLEELSQQVGKLVVYGMQSFSDKIN